MIVCFNEPKYYVKQSSWALIYQGKYQTLMAKIGKHQEEDSQMYIS